VKVNLNIGGILLCGGSGTRLFPTTKYLNKHLIPIYDKPMVYYSISILLLSGIKKITLVCNKIDLNIFQKLLGDGSQMGIEIKYSIQDSPQGIPHAINNALKTNYYEKFITVLGDNFIFGEKFFTKLEAIFNNSQNCSIFSQTVKKPDNFGVVKLDENGKILDLVEKPQTYISNLAIIGLYIFNNKFQEYFENIKKSDRNEFEILDLIKQYSLRNIENNFVGRGTAWFDMGTTEDFYNTSSFVRTIQERQGLLVCSPHEIAFRNGWIDESDINNYINSITGSEYSEHLKNLLK